MKKMNNRSLNASLEIEVEKDVETEDDDFYQDSFILEDSVLPEDGTILYTDRLQSGQKNVPLILKNVLLTTL